MISLLKILDILAVNWAIKLDSLGLKGSQALYLLSIAMMKLCIRPTMLFSVGWKN